MNFYQLIYLIDANLTSEELNSLPQKISNFILEEEGSLDKAEKPIRKKLAYFINKKNDAFLAVLNFYLIPDKLKKIEKKLKSEKEILRYMLLVNKTPKKIILEKTVRKIPEIIKKSPEPLKETNVEQQENKKEELERIDKRIEEILNTG
jgi:small subunit ribosomal protein S6